MGLILDSSVLIAAERRGETAIQTLHQVRMQFPGEVLALSVLTVLELSHGVARADSPGRLAKRQEFLDKVLASVVTHSVTTEIALRAGQIGGELMSQGMGIAVPDLLIGVTALELGYGVLTGNTGHFARIPQLRVFYA